MDETAVRGIGDLNWFNEIKESAVGKMKLDSGLGLAQEDEDELDLDDL